MAFIGPAGPLWGQRAGAAYVSPPVLFHQIELLEHHARASNDGRSAGHWLCDEASEFASAIAGRGPTSGLPHRRELCPGHDVWPRVQAASFDCCLDRIDDQGNRRIEGLRICSPPTSTLRAGRQKSRATQSDSLSAHSPGLADPMAILMSSAVRSGRGRGCTRGGRRPRCRLPSRRRPMRMLGR